MPYRKTKKAPRRRYRGRKKVYKRRNKTTIRSMTTGVPDRVRAKLKYSDIITLTTLAGGAALQVFRGNSLRDPDVTGIGHQPLYHDNYSALYEQYVVRGAKIQIKAVNHSGAISCVFMCVASTDLFTLTDINGQSTMEQSVARRTAILPVASNDPSSVSLYASSSKIMGLRNTQINDDEYSAPFGSDPSDMWYFNLGVMAMDQSTVGAVVRCQVLITYYCEFFDRKKQVTN